MTRHLRVALIGLFCCFSTLAQNKGTVTNAILRNVEARAGEWLTHGRDYAETRFSPLKQINAETVKDLGLAWSFDTNTTRGLEATPLVVNGVMYATGSWSIVYALNAKTGKQLWQYDPQVPQRFGARACCDVVNRGVAKIMCWVADIDTIVSRMFGIFINLGAF